jgi:23S rRNA pseudouridine2605 synthase
MTIKKRLSKAIAAAGVASRRQAEELIFQGRVKVNDVIITLPQTLVCWETDKIVVDQNPLHGEEEKEIYLFHKPKGVLCTHTRVGKQVLVYDFFPHSQKRLFTVGRLDKDSTGLLLVTNDGHLTQKIIHPSANIEKEYLVKVQQEIESSHLQSLSKGAWVDRRRVRPVSVRKLRRGTFIITVKEGKKHEVRILTERAGLDLIELKRIRIGHCRLGSLEVGAWRRMTSRDLKALFTSN